MCRDQRVKALLSEGPEIQILNNYRKLTGRPHQLINGCASFRAHMLHFVVILESSNSCMKNHQFAEAQWFSLPQTSVADTSRIDMIALTSLLPVVEHAS